MIIYEVENDDGESPEEYFSSLKEARLAAKSASAPYPPDDGGWGGNPGSECLIYRFEFHATKENVIAALNQMGWRPERELIARYDSGKEMPIQEEA